jgi:hypothetical protein
MLLFGWLPWAPGVSNFFFLFGNLLAISCSFIPQTQNNKSKFFFPTFPLFVKNLKKITLKLARPFRFDFHFNFCLPFGNGERLTPFFIPAIHFILLDVVNLNYDHKNFHGK